MRSDLYTAMPYRRQGAAEQGKHDNKARAVGAPRLWVESDPNAESFYRACGFRRVGETPSGSIAGRSLPLLVMELDGKAVG